MARSKKTAQPRSSASGFSEAHQEPFSTARDGKPGFGIANRVRLTLGPGGRVVVPAAIREAMDVKEGDTLLAWIEDGELHLLSPSTGARQAQAMLSGFIPKGVSLSNELIEDRRREAEAEANG